MPVLAAAPLSLRSHCVARYGPLVLVNVPVLQPQVKFDFNHSDIVAMALAVAASTWCVRVAVTAIAASRPARAISCGCYC